MQKFLETHLQWLPLPYRMAVERVGNEYDKRTITHCAEFCDAYAKTYGLDRAELHNHWKESACAIAKRRYMLES